MTYALALERLEDVAEEFRPLAESHYAEITERARQAGVEMAPFKPQLDRYIALNRAGQFLFYTVRYGGKPIAYSGMYLLPSMHTGLLIGREDTIYVEPEHRGRVGKALVRAILTDMQERGATQVLITPIGDSRLAKLWQRMGFRLIGQVMTYNF